MKCGRDVCCASTTEFQEKWCAIFTYSGLHFVCRETAGARHLERGNAGVVPPLRDPMFTELEERRPTGVGQCVQSRYAAPSARTKRGQLHQNFQHLLIFLCF